MGNMGPVYKILHQAYGGNDLRHHVIEGVNFFSCVIYALNYALD